MFKWSAGPDTRRPDRPAAIKDEGGGGRVANLRSDGATMRNGVDAGSASDGKAPGFVR